ncbi:hypothetical protein C8A00DRAFT_38745 [Chaetomidium leptoderma]|uniref:Heterokaryon incompatibility domain-containing protein n=1 Tax=Chaetomidium leptoderma TaxID=669021 RepID=A0AAN6VD32_9PEZI|nr:hypothetical protein C8A00DRAFT_38745 [Chaetomidium leptoderma]
MTAILRDAVCITRALSIPYLWIDAICILQDSIPDWEENCLDMDKIYGSAQVTLCAASSTSCHEGFLSQRGPRLRLPFQSLDRLDISGSYYLQFKYVRSLQNIDPPDVLACDLSFCRWAYRAWKFQEKALSTRQILFGNANLHFLCGSTHETMGCAKLEEPAAKEYIYQVSHDITSSNPAQLQRSWDNIVSLYGGFNEASLTRSSDVLPALAGLARLFQKRLNDEYICGLWKTNLVPQLISLVERPPAVARQTENQFAQGLFQAIRPEYQQLIPDVALAGSNRFGQVRYAKLGLTTHLLEPRNMMLQNQSYLCKRTEEHCAFKWHSDFDDGLGYLDAESPDPTVLRLDVRVEGTGTWPETSEHTSSVITGIQEFRWALLGSCAVRVVNGGLRKTCRAAFGLVLQAVPGEPGKYWRVGIFVPSVEGQHGDSSSLFQSVSEVETIEMI